MNGGSEKAALQQVTSAERPLRAGCVDPAATFAPDEDRPGGDAAEPSQHRTGAAFHSLRSDFGSGSTWRAESRL